MKPEKQRSYVFDFYCLNSNQNDLFSTPTDIAFERLLNEEAYGNISHYGSTRELFGLTYRKESNSYAGQIRKIRKADLPEVGAPGKHSKTIELNADEGVIEKNFFVFYKENSLLVMHRNDTGNTGSHLAQLLTGTTGVAFFAGPLIRPDQAEKLLNNKLNIKKFSVKIPKPTNPELYPQDSISAKTIELLNQSGADSLDVTFTIDQKLDTSAGRLTSALQSAIGSLLSMGATKAKLDTDENGKILPIDLIANRIYSKQYIKTNSFFPPSESMYRLADQAKEEQRELLDEYFGNTSRII
ncbi:hypothetical protein JYG36_13570 [Pseudomonas sp. SORT22]|uniref:DUF6731 family protein n=1 Tax=Pseudomonas sp. SORT22 TaxID=2813842 RepID=UPI001BCE1187|nr:DUF6731 family protein [Pseudomonas sp. SORT22]QVM94156.1 hypothetical protein JYG36_13570 [Pseudomonas sp. SORT22]